MMSVDTTPAVIARKTDFSDRRVFSAACEAYDQEKVCAAVDSFWEYIGADRLIKPGCNVVIKPNLVIRRSPEEATTTHPTLVTAVIRAVKRLGAGSVTVAESSGGMYNRAAMNSVFSGCGIAAVCESEGAQLNQDFGFTSIDCPDGVMCRQFNIINPIVTADVVINIAKLKTHAMTGLSGCVKNMFGSVPGLGKPEMHCQYPDMADFQQMICDLCVLTAPTISVLDAIECMEGDGPTGGSPRHVGAILGGLNPFAVDVAACRLIAVKQENIWMLRHGVERGLCPASADEIELFGDPLEPMRVADFVQPKSQTKNIVDFFPPFMSPLINAVKKVVAPRPVIDAKKCVGCGKCAESCPQHTITIDSKLRRAVIDSSVCIRCFCCHEMCPMRAIDIKRTFVIKL